MADFETKPPVIDEKAAAETSKRQIRKDELGREAARSERTWKDLREKWKRKFLQIKLPEMKEDMLKMAGCLKRWIDSKNHQISLIMDEIDEFHNQSNFISQCHFAALHKLFDLYLQRIKNLQKKYDEETKKTNFQDEFKEIIEKESNAEDNMKTAILQTEINRNKTEDLMNREMFLKIDDEKIKNSEKWEFGIGVEKKMEKWSKIAETLTDCQVNAERGGNRFEMLREKNRQDSKIVYLQMKKNRKLYDRVQELRNAQENKSHMPKTKITMLEDLEEKRLKFFSAFKHIKKTLSHELKFDESNLKELIGLTNSVIDYLKHRCKKGEKILSLYAICRKFETQKEKFLAVGKKTYQLNLDLELSNKKISSVFIDENAALLKKYETLDRFWKKVAKINLTRLGLVEQMQKEEKKNEYLKRLLLSYLKHASLNKSS